MTPLSLVFIDLCMILAFSCVLPGMALIEEEIWTSQCHWLFLRGKSNHEKKNISKSRSLSFYLTPNTNKVDLKVSVSMTKTLKHFDCCPGCAVWSKWGLHIISIYVCRNV